MGDRDHDGDLRITRVSAAEVLGRSPVVAYVSRYGGAAIWVSPRCEEIFGVPAHEWIDDPEIWTEHLHPDDRERVLAATDDVAERGGRFRQEYRVVKPDGTVVWVLDIADHVADPQGGPGFWHGVLVPIGEWKDRESFLREHNQLLETEVRMRLDELGEVNELLQLEVEERRRMTDESARVAEHYRTIVEGLPVLAYVWDLTDDGAHGGPYSNPVSVTHFTRDHWGFNPADTMRRGPGHWIEWVHPDDRDRVWEAVRHATEAGEPYRSRHRWVTGDGRILSVLDRADVASTDAMGRPTRYVGAVIDLTEIIGRQTD